MNRNQLRSELIRDEGMSLSSYKDSVGLWTIGVGHLLGDTQRMTLITGVEALALLEADINDAITRARMFVPGLSTLDLDGLEDSLDGEVRQRAIVNMTFNLGNRLGGFQKFLSAVNNGMWALAATEMMDSKWAKQVGQRAVRLRHMIETGETP